MKIGIIGGGAAWLLDQEHEVTLIEKQNRLGGHANMIDVELDGDCIPIDGAAQSCPMAGTEQSVAGGSLHARH